LSVADHPLIIQVSGATGSSTNAPGNSAPVATTVGTGPDKLVLKLSEDAYKGDAQYTVSVDGQQVGGTLTAHAAHVPVSTALADTLTVQGNFGAGPHTVSVNFLNDAYDRPGNDRNLYVDAASYNAAAVANSSLTFLSPGPQQFAVPGTAASTGAPATTTVGTGPDKLVLKLSEDAYKGDAQYTVSVDGQQVGGTLTAHAAHVAGSTALDDTLTVQGNFGAGPHTVSVNFLNDAYDGPGNDRNLYVDAASYNGAAVANSSLTFLNPGPQQFAVPGTAASTGAPATTTVGTGPDKLVLKLSEDAYKGDAQYTVSVDGQQVGGTLTAHAAHVAGSTALDDTLTVQPSSEASR
ncbi:hypothetical protein MKK84_34585, partial [Methylobacterium sp. E-065]|uniref:carbohydrate-binding domain-containing protein n=1 Tax=Methylobacterium sp. E-065 TaxID=2836583 RepID=UPI002444238D